MSLNNLLTIGLAGVATEAVGKVFIRTLRRHRSKTVLHNHRNRSMLQQTIDRVEVLVPPERVFAPCLSSASSSEFFFSNSEPMHLSSRLSVYPKWDGVNWGTKERILTSLQEIGKLDERLQRLSYPH
jgi:hypothetical protein